MENYRKPIAVAVLVLIFTSVFLYMLKGDLQLIFKKDLLAHDESANSVVTANITRQFFPPMVRVNPLNEQQGNWMEGPAWQHIPPLFAYLPYLFYELDGQVTIEVKRLSFGLLTYLAGLLFILGVYQFRKSILTTAAATGAAIAWTMTPFTHELITGYAFGVSDIVLLFAVVVSFLAILWYMRQERGDRINYPVWKLALIGAIVALPIMAKNLLGAIAPAILIILLIRDHRTLNKQVWAAAWGFAGLLVLYYLPFYFVSPETFKKEIALSFLHLDSLEGWGRPWHYYLSNYLPQRYLFSWAWAFYLGLILGAIINYKFKIINSKDKALLWLSGGWFVWNLFAVSLVESKIANFIYQSYLFSLFFLVYSVVLFCRPQRNEGSNPWVRFFAPLRMTIIPLFFILVPIVAYQSVDFYKQAQNHRTGNYNYSTEREKFYGTAEELKKLGVNQEDLVIVRVSDNDCWFRYPIIFLTGAEAKTLLEMNFSEVPAEKIIEKYNRIFFVFNKNGDFPKLDHYALLQYDLADMDPGQVQRLIDGFLISHEADIQQDVLRIKKDKTSCQWLVPDPILNAP